VFTDEPPFGGSQIELDVEVIPYEGDKPMLRPMFRYNPLEMEEMQRQIAQLLLRGYIQPSSSPLNAHRARKLELVSDGVNHLLHLEGS
jgi:hypothetical protein